MGNIIIDSTITYDATPICEAMRAITIEITNQYGPHTPYVLGPLPTVYKLASIPGFLKLLLLSYVIYRLFDTDKVYKAIIDPKTVERLK